MTIDKDKIMLGIPRPKKNPTKNYLEPLKDHYDVAVIGSGLAGLTAANRLATLGHKVILLEQHYLLGGLATWFNRKSHIFDISLHGFPIGMKKTLRKYWSKELADSVEQVKGVRFDNPQFSIETTFDMDDFKKILRETFGVAANVPDDFFNYVKAMNFYDDNQETVRDLFQKFFPDRNDIWRLLMEPITYANGSTLDDPAISYGIVFSNFMSKGVYIYNGGTDDMIHKMEKILIKNGVDIRIRCQVEKILVKDGKVTGLQVDGKQVNCSTVVSNSNIKTTIEKMVGEEHFSKEFIEQSKAVRLNNSSCQVYMGLHKDAKLDYFGDLVFTSTHPTYDTDAINSMDITSRTFSVYYPEMRPERNRCTIVSSTNANFADWANLSEEEYKAAKEKMIQETIEGLEKYSPGITEKIHHVEAATPKTFEYYSQHIAGASFGTKFEGLQVSIDLPDQIGGLYHAGSVGIIMSGWLGTANYGVITSNQVDKYLQKS